MRKMIEWFLKQEGINFEPVIVLVVVRKCFLMTKVCSIEEHMNLQDMYNWRL